MHVLVCLAAFLCDLYLIYSLHSRAATSSNDIICPTGGRLSFTWKYNLKSLFYFCLNFNIVLQIVKWDIWQMEPEVVF